MAAETRFVAANVGYFSQSMRIEEQSMVCEHEPCTCYIADGGLYCSENCRDGSEMGAFCGCGHAVCESSPVG